MKIVPGDTVQLRSGGAPLTVVNVKVGIGYRTLVVASMSAGGLLQIMEDVHCDAVMRYSGSPTPSCKEVDSRLPVPRWPRG